MTINIFVSPINVKIGANNFSIIYLQEITMKTDLENL